MIKYLKKTYCQRSLKGDKSNETTTLDQWYFFARRDLGIGVSHRETLYYLGGRMNESKKTVYLCRKPFHPIIIEELKRIKTQSPVDLKLDRRKFINNFQIDKFQMLLEQKITNYQGFITIPIDFLLNFNEDTNHQILFEIDKLKSGRYGIVINEDNSSGCGTHWVSIMIDADVREIFYFDSCCQNKCKNEIKEFLNFYLKNGWTIFTSIIPQQQGDTECGVYCMIYLRAFSAGAPIKSLSISSRCDEIVKEFRYYKGEV